MNIPEEMRADVAAMPERLRALLLAELAAGNAIVEVGHSHPAPPAGAFFKLAKPLLSRPRESGDGITFYERNSSLYSGEITDGKRFYFLLEPPKPPEPEPDMNAIRAAMEERQRAADAERERERECERLTEPARTVSKKLPAVIARFERHDVSDYDLWHDGIGYDLAVLKSASAEERRLIERRLLARRTLEWRDIEALAALGTPAALAALRDLLRKGSPEQRVDVMRYAPALASEVERAAVLVEALGKVAIGSGMTQTLDEVVNFHPPEVVAALLRGALEREGSVACHYAAMVLYLHGQAKSPFDWDQRPLFLRFNTPNRAAREIVFAELCAKIGVTPGNAGGDRP